MLFQWGVVGEYTTQYVLLEMVCLIKTVYCPQFMHRWMLAGMSYPSIYRCTCKLNSVRTYLVDFLFQDKII